MRLHLKTLILSKFGSQRQFAKVCGRYDDWISRIIQGVRSPSEADKKLICEKLGVTPDDWNLLDWDE
jgi:transcriptional regulator with XRE-family HTH domain